MADKMMRIAGRGEDGLAKSINTDDFGNLNVQMTGNTQVTNADTDSFSISGGSISSLAKKTIDKRQQTFVGTLPTGEYVEIFSLAGHVIVDSLEFLTQITDVVIGFRWWDSEGVSHDLRMSKREGDGSFSLSLPYVWMVPITGVLDNFVNFPLERRTDTSGSPAYHKIFLPKGAPMEFPNGFALALRNNNGTTQPATALINYRRLG